ncbi:thiamine phosphate synthase [Aeromicrobium sp. 179-A 4D2 NHS]|uniref:thiamine phosphate synthase n=1 Tax=Aeromicrobium sp. 179-A 4D2 NHS TaxID=3142375 RepID=UPI0039A2213A
MTLDLSVYLVTDPGAAASRGRRVVDVVAAAATAGVTAVQVREKDADAADFLSTVLDVAAVLPERVSLFVNDRVDVFLAARARGARVTGVHVGQADLPPAVVRELVGPDAVIGLSAATPDELRDAQADPGRVDYVGIGVLRATATKSDAPPPLGLAAFSRLAATTRLPAVAIGGVTVDDVGPLRVAGAAGAAVSSAVCAADDPADAARRLAAAWAGAA